MNNLIQIKINKVKCEKCGYIWIPRKEEIIGCPKCKIGYYKARIVRKSKETRKELRNFIIENTEVGESCDE